MQPPTPIIQSFSQNKDNRCGRAVVTRAVVPRAGVTRAVVTRAFY